jgi:hypothetical protein
MSDRQIPEWFFVQVGSYIERLCEEMGLYPYHVLVSRHHPPAADHLSDCDVNAQVDYTFKSRSLLLYLGDPFYEKTPDMQRHILVHELLHVLECDRMACAAAVEEMPGVSASSYAAWFAMYDRARELHTDHLAFLLAPRYAPPDFREPSPEVPV